MEATAFRPNDRNPVPLFAAKLQVSKNTEKQWWTRLQPSPVGGSPDGPAGARTTRQAACVGAEGAEEEVAEGLERSTEPRQADKEHVLFGKRRA
jgi:hypothetical protein